MAGYCLFCGKWWIVAAWLPASGGGASFHAPRPASRVEADLARRAVFLDRGREVPPD